MYAASRSSAWHEAVPALGARRPIGAAMANGSCNDAISSWKDAMVSPDAAKDDPSFDGASGAATLVCLIGNIRGGAGLNSLPWRLEFPLPAPPREEGDRSGALSPISVCAGPHAWHSIQTRLVEPLGAHVAVLVSYNESLSLLARHFKPRHVWRVPEYIDDRWRHLVDRLLPEVPDWYRRVHLARNVWGPVDGMAGSGAIIFSLRLVLLKYLDALVDDPYSRVVLTRNDLYHMCAHPPVWPEPDEVFTPDGTSNYGGVTDRHTVFHFASRHRVLGVLPWMAHGNDVGGNPERILLDFYRSQRLRPRLFCRTMFTAFQPGDPRRWVTSGARECFGSLWIKYAEEHREARQTCGGVPADECKQHGFAAFPPPPPMRRSRPPATHAPRERSQLEASTVMARAHSLARQRSEA